MTENPVVVTGLGLWCSIADDPDGFADALRDGRTGIAPVPGDGPLGVAALLDCAGAGAQIDARTDLPEPLRQLAGRLTRRSPRPVQAAAVVALQAWEGAGMHRTAPPADRIGLVVAGHNLTGRYAAEMLPRLAGDPAHVPARVAVHVQDTDHVGTLSHLLDVRGEGFTVGAASASGGVGLAHGARLVRWGCVDACLVVGALTELSTLELAGYRNAGAMAAGTEAAAPFDRRHRGFVYGQGAACLLLESERSARLRGAAVLARLAGWGLALAAHSLTEPDEDTEVRVMAAALARAGVPPADVTYVNAHGTGAPLGDVTELRALHRLFAPTGTRPWINATKGLTGHCLHAAGVVEAVAVVQQLRGGFLHPNVALDRPVPGDHRFVPDRAVRVEVRYALSNSFGFGGLYSSLLLAGAYEAAAGRHPAPAY